jgi:hypothetical protein
LWSKTIGYKAPCSQQELQYIKKRSFYGENSPEEDN